MRRITVQARQLLPGDQFSPEHHELYKGTVLEVHQTAGHIHATTEHRTHMLDLNHPVTVLRA